MFNYPFGDAARVPLFTVLKNDARYFFFRKSQQQFGGRVFSAGCVHAHVEWRIEAKTEPARFGIELERRNTEIGEHSSHLSFVAFLHHATNLAKVGMHRLKAFAKSEQPLCR